MSNKEKVDLYIMMFSLVGLVLGVIVSIPEKEFFYTFIFLINIYSWIKAVYIIDIEDN